MPAAWGLVLSGGGTRGAFEAGAVGLLNALGRNDPHVIAAASAGSICAGVLAQARTADEFAARTAELAHDILAMTHMNEVFGASGWLDELDGTGLEAVVRTLIVGEGRPTVGADPDVPADHDPIASVNAAPRHHRWHTLASTISHPVRVHRAREAFAHDPASLLTLDPLERALRGQSPDSGIAAIDESLINRPGLTLRLAVTPLLAGMPRYVTESGHVVGPDAATVHPGGGAPGVIEGILASSSVPVLFAPRPIGDDVYVDGGVLRNMPVEAAVQVGAGDIIAISANPLQAPPYSGNPHNPILTEVYERYAVLSFYDQVQRSLNYPLSDGATMTTIIPTQNVVAPFEVSGGLLAIDLDYGWLRAAEAMGLPTTAQQHAATISDSIITGRQRAWYLEEMIAADSATSPDPQLRPALESAKTMVARGWEKWQTLGLLAPPDASRWAERPETHTPADIAHH